MIFQKLELGSFASNCYIVGDDTTKEGMIIDPGAEASHILQSVDTLGLNIIWIVLTHSHFDHIGALSEVKEATNASVAIHENDADTLQNQSHMRMFGISMDNPPSPDRLLKDNDVIDIGNLHFKVLHTPGHTQGGICLLTDGIVFSGDTLFNFGIGRADFPGASYEQELDSIQRKLMVLPDNTIVYPGHGLDTTIGVERRANPFL